MTWLTATYSTVELPTINVAMPLVGLEPTSPKAEDSKSSAFTSFTIGANEPEVFKLPVFLIHFLQFASLLVRSCRLVLLLHVPELFGCLL